MTNEQFARWEDFAIRMAQKCFGRNRRPNRLWIEEVVRAFFDDFDSDDICCVSNWDHSLPYPEGHCCRRHDGREWVSPYGVGDMMPEFLDSYRDDGRRCVCATCNRGGWFRDEGCRCEEIQELCYEQWDDQWGGPVRCCIRAGLDCASSPSAGVIGFTAGDVRRMYPEGVPEWVFPRDERLRYWLSGELNGTFAELSDLTELVL